MIPILYQIFFLYMGQFLVKEKLKKQARLIHLNGASSRLPHLVAELSMGSMAPRRIEN
jgi:hypothetical protein